MSQFPHDKFAKNLFELLLTPLGGVNTQRVIQAETKFIDIYIEAMRWIYFYPLD